MRRRTLRALYLALNKSQPVRISEDDRRFNVGVFQTKSSPSRFKKMEVTIEEELEAFAVQ